MAESATATSTTLKLALLQLAVGSDKTANLANASKEIASAAAQGANFIVLPECFNCPYGTSHFPVYAEQLPAATTSSSSSPSSSSSSPTLDMLSQTARQHKVFIVGGSIPERDGDKLYNTCLCIDSTGSLVAKHRKIHLFDINVTGGQQFRESDTLTGGDALTVLSLPQGNVGVGICYDVRFPELALLYRHTYQCALLVYPGAFNMTTGPKHWELLMRARANDNQIFVAACSPARDTSAGYVAYGHSMVVGPWGNVLAEADSEPTTVFLTIDLAEVQAVREQIPTSKQRRLDIYDVIKK